MNIELIEKELIPQRKKEIEEGKNLGTQCPIYLVLDLEDYFIDSSTSYSMHSANKKGKPSEVVYLDTESDSEEMIFHKSKEGLISPVKGIRFFVDKIKAICLTHKDAKEYIKRQAHNLSDEAYIYVNGLGYSNFNTEKYFKENEK